MVERMLTLPIAMQDRIGGASCMVDKVFTSHRFGDFMWRSD